MRLFIFLESTEIFIIPSIVICTNKVNYKAYICFAWLSFKVWVGIGKRVQK